MADPDDTGAHRAAQIFLEDAREHVASHVTCASMALLEHAGELDGMSHLLETLAGDIAPTGSGLAEKAAALRALAAELVATGGRVLGLGLAERLRAYGQVASLIPATAK